MTLEEAESQIPYKTTKELLKIADDYINRINEMKKLNDEYKNLPEQHKNWNLGKNFVPGEGPLNAEVMIVGQAPGRNEDEQRRPFVGMAGQLLNEMLKKAKLKRDDVYITSIVQFFPPFNRAPTEDEISYCKPFLIRQMKIIKPKFVVLLGNIPSQSILGIGNVMKNHGSIIESKEFNCKFFITIHPAAAVRIKKNISIIKEDFEKLGILIKQKNE